MKQAIKLQYGQNEEEEGESEVINRKFIRLLQFRDAPSEETQPTFDSKEIETISHRFKQLCNDDQMNYEQFRRGLGLLGRQDSFICRIFNLIDEDGDGYITQQNFLEYLSIILRGSDLQKARFGWMILTQNKGDLELTDFFELFQQISVVWNALTGEVLAPKKKYIEQLFHTFDVDQDEIITFHDEHLLLFGWFQYFNNIEIDEKASKQELEKIRLGLRKKLKLKPNHKEEESLEEIKLKLKDFEMTIERKLYSVTGVLRNVAETVQAERKQIEVLESASKERRRVEQTKQGSQASERYMFSDDLGKDSSSSKCSNRTGLTSLHSVDSVSLKSLFKYSHQDSSAEWGLDRLKHRKERQISTVKRNFSIQLMKQLKNLLDQSYQLMQQCSEYRETKQQLRKFSPTKLKQLQVKLSMFDRQQQPSSSSTKHKTSVYFGHESWNLVLNIMVGLRKSIKSLYDLNICLQIREDHFTEEHEFMLGNKSLNGKQLETFRNLEIFKFIQVAPLVFQRLRMTYGISNDDYQRSVGPQSLLNHLLTGNLTALNQQCSTGQSGAFFYLTLDQRIFLKTLRKSEFVVFAQMLKDYFQHMLIYSNTLLVRIYGLYKLKVYVNKQKINTIYFICMENVFHTVKQDNNLTIKDVYDLKGSFYGRDGKEGKQLKDNDWLKRKQKIYLPSIVAEKFKTQIHLDSKLFKRANIIDYSLLVAIISCPNGAKLSQENLFRSFGGGVRSSVEGIMYVVSIIDYLTVFEVQKKLQYLFKTTFMDENVSCVPSAKYCTRFRDFINGSVEGN